MLSLPAVHPDDGGLVTIGIGIRGRATERLRPVSGESLDMLGVEAVAERMGDHVVGHHPTMPGVGKTAQAVVATRRLEDSLHASMMTILPCLCETMAWRVQLGRAIQRDPLSMAPGLSPSGERFGSAKTQQGPGAPSGRHYCVDRGLVA